MKLDELLREINSITIGFDIHKLNRKIELINQGLSILQINPEEQNGKELLLQVVYIGFEVGCSKAFESMSGDIHKPLVLKALPIARRIFDDNEYLLPFLKDASLYETDSKKKGAIKNEIKSIKDSSNSNF